MSHQVPMWGAWVGSGLLAVGLGRSWPWVVLPWPWGLGLLVLSLASPAFSLLAGFAPQTVAGFEPPCGLTFSGAGSDRAGVNARPPPPPPTSTSTSTFVAILAQE